MHSRYPTPRSAALLLAFISSAMAAQPRYDVVNLRPLGFRNAYALNNHGHVAGESSNGLILWNRETVSQLPTPIQGPVITDFNDAGDLVGYYSNPAFEGNRGFAIIDGNLKEIEQSSVATGINNTGQISLISGTPSRALINQAGTRTDIGSLGGPMTGITALNTAGWAVGSSSTTLVADPRHAFLFRNGTLTDLGTLGGDQSGATDINDAGNIVGSARADVGGKSRATLYTGGKVLQIGSHRAEGDYGARRINNYNVVLGHFATGPSLWSGGIVKPLAKLVDLAGLGLNVVELIDFNDRGEILVRAWEGWWVQERDVFLLTPRLLPSARLTAIAARSIAGTNDQTSISGFVLAGGSTEGAPSSSAPSVPDSLPSASPTPPSIPP